MADRFASILLFGPPGSGKGTQGKMLGSLPGFFHVSSGDVFRSLDKNSDLGKTFLGYSSKGELVPDELTIQICLDFLNKQVDAGKYNPATDLLILDGLPRNVNQAKVLKASLDVVVILYLFCSDEDEMVRRIQKRGIASGRADDADEKIVRRRLEVYKAETAPMLAQYPKPLVAEIDALGTPLEVAERIVQAMIPVSKKFAGE